MAPLIETLADPVWDMRFIAVGALERLGKMAVPELSKALKDTNARRVVYAAEALVRIDPEAHVPTLIPILVESFGSKDSIVRAQAAKCLEKMGRACKPALPALARALKDEDEKVRYSAADAIEQAGAAAVDFLPELMEALRDKNAYVRGAAAMAVGHCRSEPRRLRRH